MNKSSEKIKIFNINSGSLEKINRSPESKKSKVEFNTNTDVINFK